MMVYGRTGITEPLTLLEMREADEPLRTGQPYESPEGGTWLVIEVRWESDGAGGAVLEVICMERPDQLDFEQLSNMPPEARDQIREWLRTLEDRAREIREQLDED